MGNKISLEDQLIDLRITSKQMIRSSKKCEKNEKAAIEKLKKVRESIFSKHTYKNLNDAAQILQISHKSFVPMRMTTTGNQTG